MGWGVNRKLNIEDLWASYEDLCHVGARLERQQETLPMKANTLPEFHFKNYKQVTTTAYRKNSQAQREIMLAIYDKLEPYEQTKQRYLNKLKNFTEQNDIKGFKEEHFSSNKKSTEFAEQIEVNYGIDMAKEFLKLRNKSIRHFEEETLYRIKTKLGLASIDGSPSSGVGKIVRAKFLSQMRKILKISGVGLGSHKLSKSAENLDITGFCELLDLPSTNLKKDTKGISSWDELEDWLVSFNSENKKEIDVEQFFTLINSIKPEYDLLSSIEDSIEYADILKGDNPVAYLDQLEENYQKYIKGYMSTSRQ